MIHDIEVEVHHGMIIIPKTTIHKRYFAPHLENDLVMTRVLIHKTPDHVMTNINETRDLIALPIDPLTNHLIDVILVTYINHAPIHEITTILQDTHLPLDHPQDLANALICHALSTTVPQHAHGRWELMETMLP